MYRKMLILRVIGYALSLVLTLIAFFIIIVPQYFDLKNETAAILILCLAGIQAIVQFLFFLNLWEEKGAKWNLTVFASTIGIIFIIIFFSIWIMNTLDYLMVPDMMNHA